MSHPVRIFISYAHKSHVWLERFDSIVLWSHWGVSVERWWDKDIIAGSDDDKEIREALEKMDVFICLVTMPFLNSGYIQKVELKRALERHAAKEIEIVPLLVSVPRRDLKKLCPALYPLNPLPCHETHWCGYKDADGDYAGAEAPIFTGLDKAIQKVMARKKAAKGKPTVAPVPPVVRGRRVKGRKP